MKSHLMSVLILLFSFQSFAHPDPKSSVLDQNYSSIRILKSINIPPNASWVRLLEDERGSYCNLRVKNTEKYDRVINPTEYVIEDANPLGFKHSYGNDTGFAQEAQFKLKSRIVDTISCGYMSVRRLEFPQEWATYWVPTGEQLEMMTTGTLKFNKPSPVDVTGQ